METRVDAQHVQAVLQIGGHGTLGMPKMDPALEVFRRLGQLRGVDGIEPRHHIVEGEQHVLLDAPLRVAAPTHLTNLAIVGGGHT